MQIYFKDLELSINNVAGKVVTIEPITIDGVKHPEVKGKIKTVKIIAADGTEIGNSDGSVARNTFREFIKYCSKIVGEDVFRTHTKLSYNPKGYARTNTNDDEFTGHYHFDENSIEIMKKIAQTISSLVSENYISKEDGGKYYFDFELDEEEIKVQINLGVGRVQNVTAENVFLKEKSLYSFVKSAKGKKYSELKKYCDSYYSKTGEQYFGQIITPMNLLGLIETDDEEVLVENELLTYVINNKDRRLPKYYMNYFLCMWQYPLPSTQKNSGRNLEFFKPYCLLLKILLELKRIDINEAYLTEYDYESIFLNLDSNLPLIEDVDRDYAENLIAERIKKKSNGIAQVNGSLTYIINTLAESDILTKEASEYNNIENFYIGLSSKENVEDRAQFVIREYGKRIFKFSKLDSPGRREDMTRYCRYINNTAAFEQWRSCYMNISRIDGFKSYCYEKGFSYSDDLIRRFVLSLETKPFLLLTGISGSGKTKIAELWCGYLEAKGEAKWTMIAVGSNWTDNKKLLGFNNVLLEEDKSYQSTELVEMMLEAETSDKEIIVILDEMNLSRVEMYFADFLSALESMNHEIKLANNKTIKWAKNIKIIGTVNVDESTYMFSPKVLDRANVIEMNGNSPRKYIDSIKENDEKIYKSIKDEEWFEEYVNLLDEIYEDLNGEFAYRVMDEITAYIALNVKLYGAELYMTYVDEQVSQKILPKLHGSKAQLKPKLDKLQNTFSNASCPLVSVKLAKMQEDIKKGYTSFIGD